MTDTVRIERPMFCRRQNDGGGRVKHDSQGNAVLVRTRISDTQEVPDISAISVAIEPTGGTAGRLPYEHT